MQPCYSACVYVHMYVFVFVSVSVSMCECVYVCVYIHVCLCLCRLENYLVESVFCFNHVDAGDWSQVVRLGGECLTR